MTAAEFVLPRVFQSNRLSATRWILSHVRRHWWLVGIIFIGAFGNAALAAAVPVLIGDAFNSIMADPLDTLSLGNIAIWITISQIVRSVLQWGRNFGAELIGQRLERDIREELYVELLGKSMTFHNLLPVGDTMARATNDVREINLMFSPGINLVVGSANFLLLPLILAPSFHPSLILVPAVFIIAYALSLVQYLRELKPITTSARESFGAMNARLSEAIDGIEVVKGHAREEDEIKRFSINVRAVRKAFVRQGDVEARFIPLLLMGLSIGAGFTHAIILFRQGALNVGQVVAYVGLLQLFGFPTFVSLFAYSQVSSGLAGARRILEVINRKTELDRNPTGYEGKIDGKISFQDLSYAYPSGETCIEGIDLEIEPGQTIAIVGQTGAGKTTLIKLINRTYDVTSGKVLIDGVDVREWNIASLRRQISIIEQDVFLFSRTIAENIAFGKPDATQAEIEAAAKAAQVHNFVSSFKDGYQSAIGERGVTLSGGQRQRIALARAFLTNPSILILDDSTSSIDSATEDEIQKAIFRAAEGRTTLIITHRLSQIRWADLIVVLKQGRIEAIGAHEELMKTSPAYNKIFSQFERD
jgi:ATP-binding cassette subfamily B protein